MAHTTFPTLYTDDVITLIQNTQFDGLLDTPLKTAINIFLPHGMAEIWFLLWEQEWVDTTVKMRILSILA